MSDNQFFEMNELKRDETFKADNQDDYPSEKEAASGQKDEPSGNSPETVVHKRIDRKTIVLTMLGVIAFTAAAVVIVK